MTEQEQQNSQSEIKKRPHLASRIVRWMWIGPLSLLLAAGLFFQAPWKATILILSFLLAGTILPRAYRKWFWAGVGGVVAAIIIWVFLPEETEGWRPYTFDKELTALKAKYAVPDEENAAVIYNQLLEDYNKATFEPNFVDPNLKGLIREEPWSSKDYPEAAKWLGQHESTIAKLIEASKIEQCRFPINADVMCSDITDRLRSTRRWTILLISAANNDVAEGRINQALEKYIAVLQFGKHLCQQPALIDMLVGIGIEVVTFDRFNRFVVTGDATEERLNLIEQALAEIKHDWSYDFPMFLEHDRLYTKNLWGMFYEVNQKGKTRFSRDPYARIRPWLKEQLDGNQAESQETELLKSRMYPTYWEKKLIKAGTILGWFCLPSTPEKAGRIIDESYEKYYVMAEPDYDWGKEPARPSRWIKPNFRFMVELLAGLLEEPYYSIHDTYLRTIAEQKGSRLIIALRRYKNKTGLWPESLDEVKPLAAEEIFVDPINQSSFVYKLTEENFALYSKGKNNIDEMGQFGSTWDPNSYKEKIKEDDITIWPPKGYKNQGGGGYR
jgi:hypothetical protein